MTDRELLQQALEALVESVDDVVQEHMRWLAVYGNIPTRAAQKAQGDKIVADHKAAIDALRARLAPGVEWLGGVIADSSGEPICEITMQRPMTEYEIEEMIVGGDGTLVDVVRAIERHHGIK